MHPARPAPARRPLATRLASIAAGTLLSAFAFDLILHADLGLGPWHVLTQGIGLHLGIAIGSASIVLQLLLLATSMGLRERPGVGTVVCALAMGVLIDLFEPLVPHPDGFAVRLAFLVGGTVVMALGGALFISAALGAAPLDAVMTGVYRRVPRSLAQVRLALEVFGLLVGVVLGGRWGVGSVLIGLGIGPTMTMWLRALGSMPAKLDDLEVTATAVMGADPTLGFGEPSPRAVGTPVAPRQREVRRRNSSASAGS